ncbi:MAG: glycosyltransferase [Lachnospiraceae bacterium]|nr:glycosyltransferase [Lachnospiraceae bacterium]
MDKKPKFSIIVPVYNVRDYLGICMESLINQTIKDIEIICVNDGSTDDSLEILQQYAEKDYRIKVCDKVNGGSSSARNLGLDEAEGEFILFVDSDDILEKNTCDRLYMEILQTGADIVVFGTRVFPQYVANKHAWLWNNLHVNLRHYTENCVEALFNEKPSKPFIWNKCYRRSIIEKNNIRFDEELGLGEDNLFLFEIYPKVEQVIYIPDQLYNYRCERAGSLMDKSIHELEWRMTMHLSIIEKIMDEWKKNSIIAQYNDELYAWCVCFIMNDLDSLCLRQEKKKEIAKKVFKIMTKHGLQMSNKKISNAVSNAHYKLKKLVE